VLLATTIVQLLIVLISGSVALLADTVHNFSDALTAVPLWVAFILGRRAASRRYTFGYGRAEDLAGLMSTFEVHEVLREKISGLPFVDAVTVIDETGRLLNFSRFWPVPA